MFNKLKFWEKKSDTTVPSSSYSGVDLPSGQHTAQLDSMSRELGSVHSPTQPTSTSPTSTGLNLHTDSWQGQQPSSYQPQSTFSDPTPSVQPSFQETTPSSTPSSSESHIQERDVELILSKLDTIKMSIDNLSHRVDKLEQQQQKRATW